MSCHYLNQPSATAHTTASGIEHAKSRHVNSDSHKVYVVILKRCRGSILDVYNPAMLELARVFHPSSMRRIVSTLKRFPIEFGSQGSTAFIPSQLYAEATPPALQEFQRIYDSFLSHPDREGSINIDHGVLDSAVRRLLKDAEKSTQFPDLLANVQAVILLQILRLFDGETSGGRRHADRLDSDNERLWPVSHRIWELSPTLEADGPETWHRWMLAESTRRTILMCTVMLEVFQGYKRGYIMFTPCTEVLPFDRRVELWDARDQDSWDKAASTNRQGSLVSVREYCNSKQKSEPSSLFEKLILLSFSI